MPVFGGRGGCMPTSAHHRFRRLPYDVWPCVCAASDATSYRTFPNALALQVDVRVCWERCKNQCAAGPQGLKVYGRRIHPRPCSHPKNWNAWVGGVERSVPRTTIPPHPCGDHISWTPVFSNARDQGRAGDDPRQVRRREPQAAARRRFD